MNKIHTLLILSALIMASTAATADDTTPVIGGSIFGGGRMANVSNTTADVTATVDIYTSTITGGVFGGNDITGTVAAGTTASAKVMVHDDNSSAITSINEVYGGGNGYYKYKVGDAEAIAIGGITDDNKSTAVASGTTITVLDGDGNEVATFTTTAATTYEGLLPSLATTSVQIGDDSDNQNNIYIGEVYGGAKNAYVTTASSVTVNSGTMTRAFAGNNYGGSIAKTALTINATKKPASEPSTDEYGSFDWTGVGVITFTDGVASTGGYGIGEAYGGGNAVDITGAADVTVNDGYVGTLFGGNNLADMASLPVITLNKGSLGTVYGGGNAGNMKAYSPTVLNVKGFISDDVFNSAVKSLGFGPANYPTFLSTRVIVDAPSTGLRVQTVYGGCKAANVDHATYVHISNADYIGEVYGGCDVAGSVGAGDNVTLTADATFTDYKGVATTLTFPAGASTCNPASFVNIAGKSGVQISGNVFGSGNGAYIYDGAGTAACTAYAIKADGTQGTAVATFDNTARDIPWVLCSAVAVEGGEVLKNIYGGGNKAEVGKDGTSAKGMTYMFLGKLDGSDLTPKITGSAYAGGRMADILGSVDVIVKNGMEVNRLFAGNDIAGTVEGNNRGNFTTAVYGTGTTTALYGGTNAFNGTSLTTGLNNKSSDVYVRVENGAKITTLFGGGNGDYTYSDPASGIVTIKDGDTFLGTVTAASAADAKPKQVITWLDVMGQVGTVYGGGNAADIDYTNVCIIGAGQVGTSEASGAVYGGCKSANVTYIANVMMDSYTDASSVTTTPTVYGSVFGGCDISGNVGDCRYVTGTYDCTTDNAHLAADLTNVNAAGHTYVRILAGKATGRVFGGGNGLQDAAGTAYYTGTPAVTGTKPADVFTYPEGSTYAGRQLPVCQNTYVLVTNATVGTDTGSDTHTVFGGGQGAGTKVMHNVFVRFGSAEEGTTSVVNGTLYGGSYAGFVNSTCSDVVQTALVGYGSNTKILGDVYGGSYGNYVRGKIVLNVNNVALGVSDTEQAGIYAGNNNAGQPECEACVNYVGTGCNVSLYGGGNMAPFYGTTHLTFTTGEIGYLYGGGNHAPVYGNTIVEVLGGHVCHDVFGGGNEGAVLVNKATDTEHNSYGVDYGGNTLVIVRDDCLQPIADSNGKEPGADGYVPTFVTEATSGNRLANRDNTTFYSTSFNDNDPDAADKQYYVLKPNSAGVKSTVKIDGNIYGGGNNADVSGATNVLIGNKK